MKNKVISISRSRQARTPELTRLLDRLDRHCQQLDEACQVARELHELLLGNSGQITEEIAAKLQMILSDRPA